MRCFGNMFRVAIARSSLITLLHELAHLLAPESAHGLDFQRRLVDLLRRHLSLPHGALLGRHLGMLNS